MKDFNREHQRKWLLAAAIGNLAFFGMSFRLEAEPTSAGTREKIVFESIVQNKIKKILHLYLPLIKQMAGEEALIQDVSDRNNTPLKPGEAQKIQKAWVEIGLSDLERPYLYSPSSETIRGYESRIPGMVKCFILDQQGNVVGTAPKSKDFIHGQMDKFLKCYNHGQGQVYVNPPQLDISTKIYAVQVSVPILDQGRTIGVLVATLSLE